MTDIDLTPEILEELSSHVGYPNHMIAALRLREDVTIIRPLLEAARRGLSSTPPVPPAEPVEREGEAAMPADVALIQEWFDDLEGSYPKVGACERLLEAIRSHPAAKGKAPNSLSGCYCSDRMSGGVPCPPGKCPNVPAGAVDEWEALHVVQRQLRQAKLRFEAAVKLTRAAGYPDVAAAMVLLPESGLKDPRQ